MRVLMISKACVVGAYQRKLEEIAACADIQLTAAVPPEWRDERGVLRLERAYTCGYELVVEPMALNGSFHLHFFPRLGALIARLRPDVIHIDEEPYNFATWHALRLARKHKAKTLFFSWQNLLRRYPFPFNRMERYVLRHADAAIVGNQEALAVWRAKGYTGPIRVIPQFGIDPDIFIPRPPPPAPRPTPHAFILGYAGRLVPEKGVDILLKALAQLPPHARLRIQGAGPERGSLHRLAAQLGLSQRVSFDPLIPSTQMPDFYAQLDCVVLPSRARPNWKEQFGRVLVEAMACGVPVIGSDSGEIPNVVGDAGLIFPEENVDALAARLRELMNEASLRESLAAKGRARVLERYTQKRVAEETVKMYRMMVERDAMEKGSRL